MNTKDILARIGVVVAIVIAIIGVFTPWGQQKTQQAAQQVQKAGAILDTNYFDFFQATTGFQIGNQQAGTINTGGGVVSCNTSAATANVALVSGTLPATCTLTSVGASSTVIAIGPFTATSTLTQLFISGFSGATTTDLLIATSTTPSPALPVTATSTLGENILGFAALPATSQFFSAAGVTIGPGKGYTNPAGGPYKTNGTLGIGPGEYILVFSTSTSLANNGGTGLTQVAVPASITLKYEFQN